ncbi:hypothetical protein V2J09_020027 [Rumex salicifolius]
MHPSSQSSSSSTKDAMKVATSLSKYCAYLLFFASSLLPFSALDAESICNTVDEEAIELFKKPAFACGKTDNYEKMTELISDREIGSDPKSINVLKKGAKLGNELVTLVSDQEKRWKILAEFWAEMILFLAPSNNNETAYVDRLSEGGEFIAHLWALLIHVGITNRDDMATAFQQDDDDESQQPGVDSY